jgi:hypothetical protein
MTEMMQAVVSEAHADGLDLHVGIPQTSFGLLMARMLHVLARGCAELLLEQADKMVLADVQPYRHRGVRPRQVQADAKPGQIGRGGGPARKSLLPQDGSEQQQHGPPANEIAAGSGGREFLADQLHASHDVDGKR